MQLILTIFSLISLLSNKLTPNLKIMNGIFNFNLNQQKMMMKIHTIKDFNSINFPQKNNNYIYFPSKKGNSIKNKNFLQTNNINKNSLIGLENNDNSSSIVLWINNNDDILNIKRGSGKYINCTEDNSKASVLKDQRLIITKERNDKNSLNLNININNQNQIKNQSFNSNKNNNIQEFKDKINFN